MLRVGVFHYLETNLVYVDQMIYFHFRTEVYERVRTEMFGKDHMRQCICEVTGQVPCPGYVELPKELRGKYKKLMKTEKRQ